MVLNYCSLLGGNTLLWGGCSSEFYRYKVRAFRKKNATKIGQFIDRLLTKKNNPRCRVVGGGFVKIQNAKFRMQNYFYLSTLHSPLSTPKPSHHRSILKLLSVGCSLYGVENRCKSRVAKIWCFAVVRADRLTLIATKYPTVGVASTLIATTLYCCARNTA